MKTLIFSKKSQDISQESHETGRLCKLADFPCRGNLSQHWIASIQPEVSEKKVTLNFALRTAGQDITSNKWGVPTTTQISHIVAFGMSIRGPQSE